MFSFAKIVENMIKTILKSSSSLSITYKYLNNLNRCTLLAAFMSALFTSSCATVSVCPTWEAIYAGVIPHCIKELTLTIINNSSCFLCANIIDNMKKQS